MVELPPLDAMVATRESLHQVAEHVLAAARKTETGHISLEPSPGGFCIPPLPDGRVVAVEGVDLVVREGGGERRAALTTVRAAATLAGVAPGFPWTKHPPATPLEPDQRLLLDDGAALVLEDWFALGAQALHDFADRHADDRPGTASIYPEHFDLALTAAEVNYGFSPGDADIPLPYAYVGPHEGPAGSDDFWNAPFGAYRSIADIATSGDALDFLVDGRRRVHTARQGG